MSSTGHSWNTIEFWTMLALFYALEKAVRTDIMHELQLEYQKFLAEEKEKETK